MAAPNIQTVDLTQFRESPSSTSDVRFIFKDETTGQVRELLAHKFVLAVGSEVFMTQFYGTLKEERDAIPIEDSSYSAFKLLLNILYNKKVSLKGVELALMAELYYLVDKYLMVKVQEMLIKEVSSRKINAEELLACVKVAEGNLHMEKFSSSLYAACVNFVNENMDKVLEIFGEEEAGGGNSILLHKLMAKASSSKAHQSEDLEWNKELRDPKQILVDFCNLTNRPSPCFTSWIENGVECARVKVGEDDVIIRGAYQVLADAEGFVAMRWLDIYSGDIGKVMSNKGIVMSKKKGIVMSKKRAKRIGSFFHSLDSN